MEKYKKYIIILILTFSLVGCDSIMGTSTTNQSNLDSLKQAEIIQTVYWDCYNNPNEIKNNKSKWNFLYGETLTNIGIKLYEDNAIIEIEETLGESITKLSPEAKIQLIQKFQELKNNNK